MIRRHYCFKRKSLLDDPLQDIKWIQEHGFEVTKRRPSTEAKIDSFGSFIDEPTWEDNKIYIVFKQDIDKSNQTVFGGVDFDGSDTIQFITTPNFDVRKNDLIIIPSEYDIYSDSEIDEVYKVKKILANSFDYALPRSQIITAERRHSTDLFTSNMV